MIRNWEKEIMESKKIDKGIGRGRKRGRTIERVRSRDRRIESKERESDRESESRVKGIGRMRKRELWSNHKGEILSIDFNSTAQTL